MTGTTSTPKSDVAQAITSVYRTEWGRIIATLIRLVRDFDLAKETAQEAFAAAVNQWKTRIGAVRTTNKLLRHGLW